jgi:uncharacterized protein YndB with AHSA1/START domain
VAWNPVTWPRVVIPQRKDDQLPEFTITRQIDAPVETVWEVLHDFGDIQRWSPGVTYSALTSQGPVSEGSTRHCDFAPFGGVHERVDRHVPNERLTVNLYETYKLPISGAIADFNIAPRDDGTELTLHYSYTPNLLGRLMKSYTDKQMRKGIGGITKGLQRESESIATSA